MNRPANVPGSVPLEAALEQGRGGDLEGAVDAIEGWIAASAADAAPDLRSTAARGLDEIARRAESRARLGLAERALAAATSLCPDYADLQCHHARALSRLDRRPEARRALLRALDRNPAFVEARLDLALLDACEGRVGESLEAVRRLSREAPVAEPEALQRGVRSLEHGDWEQADSLLRRAFALEHPEFVTTLTEARELLARGEGDAAAEHARRLVDRHPAYPDSHALLGEAELMRGHTDDALNALARALELYPGYHEARVLLARALEAQGAFGSAAEQVAMVLESIPDHAGALEIHERWTKQRSSRFTSS